SPERLAPPEHDEGRRALEQCQQRRRRSQRIEGDVGGETVRADASFLAAQRQWIGARQHCSSRAARRSELCWVGAELEPIAVVAEQYVPPLRIREDPSDHRTAR